ncbi:Exodeoxyribonuclease 7 large subunit [Roseivivax sp. THAF40]|uniref:exodeoxyribonuclease VII large subunit n=1 Tax=unclassified Roseivivax TaxID=2639302 RepID=UPI0012681B5F|nr:MULTISPECIES: exodeoxyribonuclease VII large subunit [unclassified Roseivivax]QFS83871.1 Exodeoxyribonuclease 7 large subunit [Roseivivax sp. THAF197b]QFT47703.1 Exodeoxyribonuclease 7 large subunit [Roseivivax sp. THAF40]
MDLIEGDETGNTPEFTVSEISGAVKRVIEGEFGHVRIRGEVGRVSRPRSGHVYLDLKDDRSVISGVMWKGVAARQDTQPEEGMEVIAIGRLTTFPGQSKYQVVIEEIRPAGMGALMAMLEKRRKMLAGEGLFDEGRKQPIPFLPEVIGVVTSPSGAVIRDILHRLRDRFPRKVLIWPVAVQGQACAPEVARAIQGFNALTPGGALPRPDVLIVARGGGSVEDLWGFNEEAVVRAAAASDIPLISAVGHETDTTLIDFAADRRAPTPTAAAEMAVPVRRDLLVWSDEMQARLSRAVSQRLELRAQRVGDLARALPRPETLLETARQRLDTASDRLPAALIRGVQTRRVTLSETAGALRPSSLRARSAEARRMLESWGARLDPALARLTTTKREALGRRTDRLRIDPIAARVSEARTRLDALTAQLETTQKTRLRTERDRLDAVARLNETLSYKATLARGYAVVRGDGQVTTTKAAAEAASGLEIEFQDGTLRLGGTAPKSKPKAKPPEQGSLF